MEHPGQAEFTQALAEMARDDLETAVRSLSGSCFESQLLAVAFPKLEVLSCSALVLYRSHFLLFNQLYHLQEVFDREGIYLHIHCMRILHVPYPPVGGCRHFEEGLMAFCPSASPTGEILCSFHRELCPDGQLDALSAKYFYLDQANFFQLTEETAEAFLNGAWEILHHHSDLLMAFKTLGLSENADLCAIKARFRDLARRFHPDLGAEAADTFIEVNRAYRLLMRVLPLTKARFNTSPHGTVAKT